MLKPLADQLADVLADLRMIVAIHDDHSLPSAAKPLAIAAVVAQHADSANPVRRPH